MPDHKLDFLKYVSNNHFHSYNVCGYYWIVFLQCVVINLFKCLNLYYNYVKNEIFLNNQPNSSNSNINIKDENTLLYLEKLIANFNK